MALASKVGTYTGGAEAIGPDIESWVQNVQDRVNAISHEQMGSNTVDSAQLISLAVTLAKIATGAFTADATGRGKFASAFINRALQDNVAKGAGSYVRYEESLSNGAVGDTPSAGDWNVRDVSLVTDAESIGAGVASSGRFELPAGTYVCRAFATQNGASGHGKLRVRDITGGTSKLNGLSIFQTVADVSMTLEVSGQFTLAVASNVELQHYTSGTSTNGLGKPISSGVSEDYSAIEFWKVGPDPT